MFRPQDWEGPCGRGEVLGGGPPSAAVWALGGQQWGTTPPTVPAWPCGEGCIWDVVVATPPGQAQGGPGVQGSRVASGQRVGAERLCAAKAGPGYPACRGQPPCSPGAQLTCQQTLLFT